MHAVVTPVEMAAIDAAAPEPVEVLIRRAGAAVARSAIDLLGGTYGRRVVVVAGKGNNGNDGREAARRLEARGVRCQVLEAINTPPVLPRADLVIDAAFGTGFRGSFNAPGLPDPAPAVLAVDIPSGVDGLTGQASGRVIPADVTVSFAALKPGLVLGEGPDLAGRVEVADIGLDVSGATAWLIDDATVAKWLPTRSREHHKWRSAVRLVAGAPGMSGAAHLAASAALRGGAGYVRLSTPGSEVDPFAPTEAVVFPLPAVGWAQAVLDEDLDRFTALAVGPGLGRGPAVEAAVRTLVRGTTLATVVDGDGITALGTAAAETVAARPPGAGPVVLTPHDGEFVALTGDVPGPDRLAAARSVASASGAVTLLKGATTVVADPTGSVLISTTGDSRLSTAGTGDVLTGLVSALLATGLTGHRAAAVAAHLHGRAGALALPRGLVASDLLPLIPLALSRLQEPR